MVDFDVIERAKHKDTATAYVIQTITSAPSLAVLLGTHQESLSVRAVRTDALGRLLVSAASSTFDIINTVLSDVAAQVLTGASVFRRIVFYAQNANMNISFKKGDGTTTNEITVVPSVPLTIEGVFIAVLARNSSAGVAATLQAVVNSDPLAGQ